MADPKNKGDPTLMRGQMTPIAEWAVRHAANLVNAVRSPFRAPPTSTSTSTPPVTPAERVIPPVPMPSVNTPAPGTYRYNAAGIPVPRAEPWFGPGTPPTPQAPREDVAGRALDYPAGVNMQGKPRQYSGVTFEQLRGMADSLDVVRLCIETRKDQIGALTWSILPKQQPGEQMRGKADARCLEMEGFFERPDGRLSWDTWVRELMEELFVIDAPAVYVRRTLAGAVHALEIVSGDLIKPLLDVTGRTPAPPMTAYQQILKGAPAVDYTTDELLYAPRNRRANHVYGLSPVEQIVMTINIAIRREVVKLQYFTEGNVPEMLIAVPTDWSADTIARFQIYWDEMLKDSAKRAGARFVPGGMTPQPTRSDGMLQGPFDEWVARVVCFAFSLPPTAFVQQMNRATADTAQETALSEGLRPVMVWLKSFIDYIIQVVFGYSDLELVYDDVDNMDPEVEREQERADQMQGILSIDEIRAKRGLDPIGISNFIQGGPLGVIFLDDLAKLHAEGVTLQALRAAATPPAPPQYDEMGNLIPQPAAPAPGALPAPGAPTLALPAPAASAPSPPARLPPPVRPAPPPGADPLAGIPANILAAVGLGPQGAAGQQVIVTRGDEVRQDPEMAAVGHPQTLAVLRGAEAMHRNRGKS